MAVPEALSNLVCCAMVFHPCKLCACLSLVMVLFAVLWSFIVLHSTCVFHWSQSSMAVGQDLVACCYRAAPGPPTSGLRAPGDGRAAAATAAAAAGSRTPGAAGGARSRQRRRQRHAPAGELPLTAPKCRPRHEAPQTRRCAGGSIMLHDEPSQGMAARPL